MLGSNTKFTSTSELKFCPFVSTQTKVSNEFFSSNDSLKNLPLIIETGFSVIFLSIDGGITV